MGRIRVALTILLLGVGACGGLIAPGEIDDGGQNDDEGQGGGGSAANDAGRDATRRDGGVVDSGLANSDANSFDSSSTRGIDAEVANVAPCASATGNIFYVQPIGVADAGDDPMIATQTTGPWGNYWYGWYLGVYVQPDWDLGMSDKDAGLITVGNYSFGETGYVEYFAVITPSFMCEGPAAIRIDQLEINAGGDSVQRMLMTFRVTCSLGGESGSASGCVSYRNP